MSDDTYHWAAGYHAKVEAEKAGRALARLAKDGELSAEQVLSAAKSERSPLHPVFEWDDTTAAHEYRLTQARTLTRSLRIVTAEHPEPERVYFHVKIVEGLDAYVTSARVLSDPELYEVLKAQALAAITSARDRYREVDELGAVWAAVDQLALEPIAV